MTTSRSRVLPLLLLLLLGGCSYTVRLLSEPEGAIVTLPDGTAVSTPTEVEFAWRPGLEHPMVVEAAGYRRLEVDMRRTEGRFLRHLWASIFQRGPREVTYLLIPDRPPVGTATDAASPR